MNNGACQIHCLPEMSERIGTLEVLWQKRSRIRRIVKRRRNYMINLINEIFRKMKRSTEIDQIKNKDITLQPGDIVRVRSREQIKATLDRWNQLKKCAFMEEMWPYCGTTQKIFKRVENFLDERDYLIKKCKGIVALEGVFCEGTKDFGPCDRSCFLFWREEWLEKTVEK